MRVEQIGRATLYCGDSRELVESLAADVMICDPPYGIGFEYLSYHDSEESLERLIAELIAPAIERLGRAVITPGNTNLHKYPKPLWTGAWTWDTTTARGFCGWSQWQPILIYGEDPAKGFGNHNGYMRSDRIHFSGGQADIQASEGGIHSCPKPTRFMQRLVARFSNVGETIFDPFLGSGTTGVACVGMDRNFIGCEIEPAYFDIACKRIEDAQRQGNLFDAA
jgi:site-specific DNA-methyltransferase (adenine-specific)